MIQSQTYQSQSVESTQVIITELNASTEMLDRLAGKLGPIGGGGVDV